MLKILIDTTKRYEKSVKLLDGERVVGEKFGDLDVVSSISELLVENNLKVSDIESFEANPGPGSFTGLKIGVTIANTLNWVLGKKKVSELTYPNYGSDPNIHKTPWVEK